MGKSLLLQDATCNLLLLWIFLPFDVSEEYDKQMNIRTDDFTYPVHPSFSSAKVVPSASLPGD